MHHLWTEVNICQDRFPSAYPLTFVLHYTHDTDTTEYYGCVYSKGRHRGSHESNSKLSAYDGCAGLAACAFLVC